MTKGVNGVHDYNQTGNEPWAVPEIFFHGILVYCDDIKEESFQPESLPYAR